MRVAHYRFLPYTMTFDFVARDLGRSLVAAS